LGAFARRVEGGVALGTAGRLPALHTAAIADNNLAVSVPGRPPWQL